MLLRRLGVADEVQEPGVVLVHYAKLLIKEVFDGVPGMKGVSVVDDGGGRRHPAGFGVERLLLMLVPSKDHHGAQVQPVERGGHGIEGGRGDHAGFVDDRQVVFIQAVVHLVTKRGVHGDVERTVQHVGVDVGQEDFVVALGQQGHRGSDKNGHLILHGEMNGSYEHLGFPGARFAEKDSEHAPATTLLVLIITAILLLVSMGC